MEKHKLGWRSIVLNVLAIIFLAAFFYGIFISVSQVASMVAQYKAMGTSIPTSYAVQQIVFAIMQYALPELFFAVMCAAVSKIIDHMGIGADKAEEAKTEEAKTEDTPAEDETAFEEAVPSTEELNVEPAESSEEKEDAEEA
ncbi:hypothetical protein [uncultured Pseudoramibacter sp.]|uniref:hypothetical protein n=1 Tax=uncultured Pseudoramibacter sp. TaxID=1623493 RepID=UPI0025E00FF7|nr:hypothetical protein [uncultured Pseudoramibacter sp.]